jgi:tRNA(Arg) A34 adenosine deaminase TadA
MEIQAILLSTVKLASWFTINFAFTDANPHPTGEIAAIKNCTSILTDPNGKFRMSAPEAQEAFADLTLYTNAESCPMVY